MFISHLIGSAKHSVWRRNASRCSFTWTIFFWLPPPKTSEQNRQIFDLQDLKSTHLNTPWTQHTLRIMWAFNKKGSISESDQNKTKPWKHCEKRVHVQKAASFHSGESCKANIFEVSLSEGNKVLYYTYDNEGAEKRRRKDKLHLNSVRNFLGLYTFILERTWNKFHILRGKSSLCI